jgi:transcription antitermination factor NusA-like protein
MFSQLNQKGIHHVQDYNKSAVFSLGLVTLTIIYQVFKAKINNPEFKNQMTKSELDELIFEIEFDLIYNKEAGSVDSDYLRRKT